MGELCSLATVSCPDICARLTQLSSKVNERPGSDIYRLNALIKNAKTDQPRAILKYASSSFPPFPVGPDRRGRPRSNGERLSSGVCSLAVWSDAAYGDLSQNGKCRLGYLISNMSSSLSGPCHILQWTSKFTRKLVKSSLGGGGGYLPSGRCLTT